MRHHRIMRALYKQTFRSDHKLPMAAAVVRGCRIVSFGINRVGKSHPEQKGRSNWQPIKIPSIHAELDALIRADYELIEGSTIYVVRRKRSDDSFGMARPCERCLILLKDYGIDKIVYSISSLIEDEDCFMEEQI